MPACEAHQIHPNTCTWCLIIAQERQQISQKLRAEAGRHKEWTPEYHRFEPQYTYDRAQQERLLALAEDIDKGN